MTDFTILGKLDVSRWELANTSTRVNSRITVIPVWPGLKLTSYFPLRSFLVLDTMVPGEINWSGCRASFKPSGSDKQGPGATRTLRWGLVCVFGQATKLPSSTSPECVGNSGHGCTLPLDIISWTMTATQSVVSVRPCTWVCPLKTPRQTSLLPLSKSSTSSPRPAKNMHWNEWISEQKNTKYRYRDGH